MATYVLMNYWCFIIYMIYPDTGSCEKPFIQVPTKLNAGHDQLHVECRPPPSWDRDTSTVLAIQLIRNTSNTLNHNTVSVYQGSEIRWQDTELQNRATASGDITDASAAYIRLTIGANGTKPVDAARYTCRVVGMTHVGLQNLEVSANVSLYVPKLCMDGWIHMNHSCYQVNRESASWTEAKWMCEIHNGHLAYVETPEIQLFLHNLLVNLSVIADYWVGASDSRNEGDWKWEPSNINLTYTNWFPGQPNNGRLPGHDVHEVGFYDQNCVLLRYSHDLKWIDSVCSDKHFYICETKTATLQTVSTLTTRSISAVVVGR